MKVEFTYHKQYFDIALEHYKEIKILQKERDEIIQSLKVAGKSSSDEMADSTASKNDRIGHLALIVVVFSALSLEAFINDYAIGSFSKSYFENYLDKIELFSKWIVIPRIITGTQLDPGSKALQGLDWLIKLRNRLVHYKSKVVEIKEIANEDFLWEEDAQKAMGTVRNLMLELKKIDNKVNIAWVETSTRTK